MTILCNTDKQTNYSYIAEYFLRDISPTFFPLRIFIYLFLLICETLTT